ncbi:hypothetical protein [Virgisporangium ochraceum]|uniref:hypothetical protein n=1 Tax=Virgisporangium ochraceum TaxID=65505 RepID=UPI001942F792|nr:hypothetical protein [Virgisporangium ochraceum]
MTLPQPLPAPAGSEPDESFVRFVRENSSTILRYLTRVCFDPHLAEDALQEALTVAMSK